MDKQWLSVKEAADEISASYDYVYRAVVSGILPATNLGSRKHGHYRIKREDLEAFMKAKQLFQHSTAHLSALEKKWGL